MDVSQLVERLADEGTRLADAVGHTEWDAPVPRTQWSVRDLVIHLGGVHRWARDVVRTGALDLDTPASALVGAGPRDDELLDWFVAGHTDLVAALRAAPEDLEAGTFLPALSPLHFWARRQAHETAIHRADADAACGRRASFDADFAQDGLAELLLGFAARRAVTVDDVTTLLLHADEGSNWLVTLGDGACQAQRDTDSSTADVIVSGSSSDLYLWSWNRDCDVVFSGQQDLATQWAEQCRVTWT